jgi:hypothetical protein
MKQQYRNCGVADDIIAVFVEAKWHVVLNVSGVMIPPQYGLLCSVDNESEAGRALATVLRTLPTADVKTAPHKGFVATICGGIEATCLEGFCCNAVTKGSPMHPGTPSPTGRKRCPQLTLTALAV